jgi:type I restriction enzyme S subunit
MSNNNENKLLPRLRFPEFQHSGEWEVKKLGEVFDFQEGFPFSSRDLTDNKENAKQVVRITEINNHNKNAGKVYVPNNKIEELSIEYYKVTKGDLLLSLTGAAGFNFFIWNGEEAYLNQRNVKFIPKDKINKAILFLIEPLIHKKINLMGTGQNNNLSKEALKDVLLLIPKLPEQQKIASCLSSLDEVIAGERQKLALLQQHKKGLLQQLFPQEGETVPTLRFKEFEDSGEWEVKELSELGYLINGLTYSPEDIRDKGLLVLRSSNIKDALIDLNDCVYVREDIKGANLIKPKDILVCVRNGSKNLIGKNAMIPEGIPFATHGAFMTVFRAENPAFVFQLFQTDHYSKQVKADLGATINSINVSNLIKYKFPVPKNPAEQQKIASCLSSLDDVINAQTQKIELLEQHKKGLLQGLFPNVNDHG